MTVEQNDPTVSGFSPPASGVARLSGNETEMLCLKAARGAGLTWGLAEEVGYAARWLQTRGIDGTTVLLAHLDWLDGRPWDTLCPEATGKLRARGAGLLCPIALGATLSDVAVLPEGTVGPVARPVLVLPFLHPLAQAKGETIEMAWQGGRATVTPLGAVGGDLDVLGDLGAVSLTLAYSEAAGEADAALTFDGRPSATTLALLNDYAMKITVPASGSSRVDAGAGTGDND